jgi:antitoxin FitA
MPEVMSRMIQIRNIPDGLHRKLKARAAVAGMTLSNYLLAELRQIVERPTLNELRARLQQREPVTLPFPAARAVRAERDAR